MEPVLGREEQRQGWGPAWPGVTGSAIRTPQAGTPGYLFMKLLLIKL